MPAHNLVRLIKPFSDGYDNYNGGSFRLISAIPRLDGYDNKANIASVTTEATAIHGWLRQQHGCDLNQEIGTSHPPFGWLR